MKTTWNDLAKSILEMPDSEKSKPVFFREPWDKDAEMFIVDVYTAKEDLANPEGVVEVHKDEFYLGWTIPLDISL